MQNCAAKPPYWLFKVVAPTLMATVSTSSERSEVLISKCGKWLKRSQRGKFQFPLQAAD